MKRYFEKPQQPDPQFWQIERIGVRYHVAWGIVGAVGTGMTCTRESEADCARMVERKIREKVKAGFIERQVQAPPPSTRPLANVLDAYAAHANKFGFNVHAIEGVPRAHHVFGGLGHEQYLLVGPDDTIGLWFAVKAAAHDPALARRFLQQLDARHAEVFSVEVVRKLRLDLPIGELRHAIVLAPAVAQLSANGLVRRQLFQAFPIHDCEFRGDEHIAEAEARTRGRNSIGSSTWNRAPQPVLDLRFKSSASRAKPRWLVFPPQQLLPMVRRLQRSPAGSVLEVRNYQGRIYRLTRTAALEMHRPDELEARVVSEPAVLAELEPFLHCGVTPSRAAS